MKVYEGNSFQKILRSVSLRQDLMNLSSPNTVRSPGRAQPHNIGDNDIEIAWVPGAYEIPLIASKMAKSGKYDAVICLWRNNPRLHIPLRIGLQRGYEG